MTCDATKEALRLAAGWTRCQFGDQYVRDGFPTRVPPCDDHERGRAAALEEAAAHFDSIADACAKHMDPLTSMVNRRRAARIRAMAGDAPEYTGVRTTDLEALLDLHDGEPLGLARDAYDRLHAAVRRGRG